MFLALFLEWPARNNTCICFVSFREFVQKQNTLVHGDVSRVVRVLFFFLVCPSTLDLNRVILAGKPAHVILHSPMSNLYGKDPLVYDVAHALCRNGGSCRKRVDVWDKAWARLMGLTPPLDLSPANEKPPKEPLAKSCAVCNKLGTMRACGKCKLIRYCGKECQIADWKRHKTICNLVSLKKKMMVTRQLLT